MSVQENLKMAKKFFKAMNAHDFSLADGIYAPNYKAKAPGRAEAMTADESRAYNQIFLDAFPDLNFEIADTISEGEFVVINWIGRGTHTGGLRSPSGKMIPATNKKAAVHGSTTYQFKNGKAVRSWVFWDMATLLGQLGLMPDM